MYRLYWAYELGDHNLRAIAVTKLDISFILILGFNLNFS